MLILEIAEELSALVFRPKTPGMRSIQHAGIAAAVLLGAVSLTQEAAAIEPVEQGTFALSAERLAASNFHFYQGGFTWVNQFLGAPGQVPFDTPRVGFDYFVIDGLSVGGHLGFGFYVWDNNGGSDSDAWIALMPRVGYAFSLTDKLTFWPRLGLGVIAGDAAPNDTGVLSLEGMFLYDLNKTFALEFGPAIDLPFAAGWQDAIVGANAGIVARF